MFKVLLNNYAVFRGFFGPRFWLSFSEGGKMHLERVMLSVLCSWMFSIVAYIFPMSWVKPMFVPYLPEHWAPSVRWPLDLEIILILPDGSSTVLIKLVQVGPDSVALVPALGSSLCLLRPADIAARSHSSQLQWQSPLASALAYRSQAQKTNWKVRSRLNTQTIWTTILWEKTLLQMCLPNKLAFLSVECKIIP